MSKISLPPGSIRVYFVEEDDHNRERVISGVLKQVVITEIPEYESVLTDEYLYAARVFKTGVRYVLEEAEFVPFEDGTVLRMENFSEEEWEEYNEH